MIVVESFWIYLMIWSLFLKDIKTEISPVETLWIVHVDSLTMSIYCSISYFEVQYCSIYIN